FQEGRFAAAGRPQDCHELALGDIEADLIQREHRPARSLVLLAQILDGNYVGRVRHRASSSTKVSREPRVSQQSRVFVSSYTTAQSLRPFPPASARTRLPKPVSTAVSCTPHSGLRKQLAVAVASSELE